MFSAFDYPYFWICTNTESSGFWYYEMGNQPNYLRGNDLISDNVWYMLTCVFDHGKAYFYRDGKRIGGTTEYTNKYIRDIQYFALGNSYTGTQWKTDFCGYLSDFRMYSSVLSDSEVYELYSTSASITDTGTLLTAGEIIEK